MVEDEDEAGTILALDELIASLRTLEARDTSWPAASASVTQPVVAFSAQRSPPADDALAAAVSALLAPRDAEGGEGGRSLEAAIARLEALNEQLTWAHEARAPPRCGGPAALRAPAPAARGLRGAGQAQRPARLEARPRLRARAPSPGGCAPRQVVRGVAAQLAFERAARREAEQRAAAEVAALRADCDALRAGNAALRELLVEHALPRRPPASSSGASQLGGARAEPWQSGGRSDDGAAARERDGCQRPPWRAGARGARDPAAHAAPRACSPAARAAAQRTLRSGSAGRPSLGSMSAAASHASVGSRPARCQ